MHLQDNPARWGAFDRAHGDAVIDTHDGDSPRFGERSPSQVVL